MSVDGGPLDGDEGKPKSQAADGMNRIGGIPENVRRVLARKRWGNDYQAVHAPHVFHVVSLSDGWLVVCGDGDNAWYEWLAIVGDKVIADSGSCGYGCVTVALLRGLEFADGKDWV